MTSQRDAASGIINLLASVLPIIAKCTPALDPETTQLVDKDIQFSYIRLQARCFLVAEELSRVKNLLDPTREDIQVLLANLESMLTPTDSVSNTHLSVPHSYARLIALRDESLHLQHLPSKQKHRILTKWLDYTSQHRNDRIGRVLQSFHDDCQDRYVEGAYTLPVEPPSPPQRREPPFGVSDAAESVFGSLLAAKPCTCHPNRHYGARLCLATHRKPEEIASKFSFDLFITPDETWQQVQITLRERQAMTLKLNDHPSTTLDDNSNVAVKEVTALCKPIAAMRNWRWRSHRLMFAVESGKLWSLKPEEQRDPIDYIGDPISLEDFIAHRQTPFTDMTKRIVAVLLAYTILHLLGTRWIQPQWGPSNVVFLPITSTIPIKPYVQVSLADDCATCTLQQAEESIDDFFDDDDLDQHPFPHLVMLAIMLMQVYLARTFRSFAVEFQVDNPDSISANEKYALASQIFQKYSRVISYSEKYWAAIESCLDPYIGKSVDDTDLDTYTLRRVMYEKIIGPLEDELVQGRFSSDDLILNLDVKASNLDLANWGQEIRLQAQHQSMQTTLPMRQLAKRHQWNPVIPQHSACITPIRAGAGKYTRAAHRGKLLSSTSPASWHSTWRSGFFDDQILPKDTEQGMYVACSNAVIISPSYYAYSE